MLLFGPITDCPTLILVSSVDYFMLMIAGSIWPWYWPEGHYGCPKGNTKAIPLQATINLFIWLLELTLIPRFYQAIMGIPGHYGYYLAIMGRPLWALLHIKGNNKHSQFINNKNVHMRAL